MQQHIGRLTTRSGTEVAYASVGAGRPLVYINGWLSHLELSWELPAERAFYESIADRCRLVRYDRAGCGLSSSSNRPPSMAYELEQLAAVAELAGAEPFDVIGTSMGALVAIAWAAAHPETVRRLVLYGGWVTGTHIASPSVSDHLLGLVESNWGLGADVLTDIFAPDATSVMRKDFGRYQRGASTAETARSLLALSYDLDVSDLLAQVSTPTLVVHRAHDRAAPVTEAAALADGIPNATLVVVPGRSHLPYVGDARAVVAPIRRFLGLGTLRRGPLTLTPRQTEVAALISHGRTNREIATRLGINERSAEGHVERIRTRLGFTSRTQIAAWYVAQHDGPAPSK